jgi:polyphenol oxidase
MEFENKKLEWLEFDLLEKYPFVLQRTFTRHGGVSKDTFSSLNLSDHAGDHPDNVKVNRELIRQSLDVSQLVFAEQTHGKQIFEVVKNSKMYGSGADALFTEEKDIALVITHADCQAALFFDPVSGAIGAVHAGWRGLVNGIYQEMIAFFEKRVKAKAQNLIVCIAPSLGPDHSEFKNFKKEIPEKYWSYQVKPFYFNLWDIARKELVSAGVSDNNIEISEVCSCCNKKDYFSYRREKITGRNATCIAIKATK